jgi:hypothetical protein
MENKLLKQLRDQGLGFRDAIAAVKAVADVYQPGMDAAGLQAALSDEVGSPAWLAILIQLIPLLLPIFEKLFGGE